MIIKSVQLENIRSYEEATIELPSGTILFQGDIRSGKSTILYSIEFALFGLGSIDGRFLLRNGSTEGSVSLVFEVDGQEYEAHRGLKRREKKGKGEYSITQTDCWLRGPKGTRMPFSASEMKEEILKTLNFNEPPASRAQSVIYRYAIFTPQDEMKDIIRKDPDDRLQTLRKAFRVEDYKVAATNVSTITSTIKERNAVLTGQTSDLEQKKGELEQERIKVEEAKTRVGPFLAKESSLDAFHKKKQEELGKLRETKGKVTQLEQQIPEVKSQKAEKEQEKGKLAQELSKLTNKIEKELKPEIEEAKHVERPTTKTRAELKKEREALGKKIKEFEEQKGGLKEQESNFQKLVKDGKCPVCLRTITKGDFGKTLAHVRQEKKTLEGKILQLERRVEQNEELEEKLKEYEQFQRDLRKLRPQLEEATDRIKEIAKQELPEIEEIIEELGGKLDGLLKESKKLENISQQIETLEKERGETEGNLKEIRREIGSLNIQIEEGQKDIERLGNEIEEKHRLLKVRDSLNEHKTWLTDYFGPTVENIEKHMMYVIWEKMNEQFQRWFQILIEDPNLQARIFDEFTPIVTQNGFDQDFESLSGGEKTSVALAYRLALNSTVREITTGVRPNMLILDEPTDGFSKEQLFRIRDLLAELKCPQVIIVSHEEELDTCADHIFKVERVNGISQVSPIR